MLYSIVPPIVVVLSLIGIILFLMKRASRVAQLREDELDAGGEYLREDGGRQELSARQSKLKALGTALAIGSEKGSHFLQGALLGAGKMLGGLVERIKNRQTRRPRIKIEKVLDAEEPATEDEIIRKLKNYAPVKTEVAEIEMTQIEKTVSQGKRRLTVARKSVQTIEAVEEEKVVEPVISKKVTRPRKTEMKDRLEELLIERIALNPKDIEAYERLGEYYMEIENYQFAKECFKQVVKLDPTNKNVKYKMRRLEYLLGR